MSPWIPAAAALIVEAGILSFIAYVSGVLDWEAKKVEQRHPGSTGPEPYQRADHRERHAHAAR